MANNPISPTREQLNQFIKDPRVIRSFEEIFAVLEENIGILNDFGNIINFLQLAVDSLSNSFQEGGDVEAKIIDNTEELLSSSRDLVDYTAAANATMNNGPVAGDPSKWVAIDDNGTIRYLPLWS